MALQYASIIIDISHENVDRVFQYRIPGNLLPEIRIGTRVCVPFGSGNRQRTGYVVGITDQADYEESKIKEITGVEPDSVTADSRLVELAWWMKERYGCTMNQALKTVLPVKRRVKARNQEVVRSLVDEKAASRPPVPLNPGQAAVVEMFRSDYDRGLRMPCLIYGVTGSGKTEVYMAMIDHVLAEGRQAIVLIPEIALTYQTVMRFYQRFGSRICVMHSRLSAGEKYDQFERARRGETDIMIGARSALFTPFDNLGLIILDEEHEGAYKSEGTPRYHARETAEKLARIHDAQLVLGSATPSLEAYSRAQAGLYRLYCLKDRAGNASLARTEVVDLRQEMRQGNKSVFSLRLQDLVRDRLARGEQTMLFMNRRGYANFVSCRSCGEAVKCPHCDVSMTLHNKSRLVCHYCGYTIPLPKTCPACGSAYLAGFGTGTQKIEELARDMFPEARILRMDLDTTSRKGGHEAILSAFAKGEADILIGTQMIVKGHDFPNVTLVGVMAADLSLYAPDYKSAERTFELLTQASGRAGRGDRAGDVIIQTYAPDHFAITAAADQDYGQFYKQESLYRKMMGYPPEVGLLTITLSSGEEESLGRAMADLHKRILKEFCFEGLTVIGPVNGSPYKLNDIYRKNLYIKHESYDILLKVRKSVQSREKEQELFRNVSVQYDG